MTVKSAFENFLDRGAQRVLGENPVAAIGFAVDTADVLETEISKNPFFVSLNNTSLSSMQSSIDNLRADTSKTGFSVVTTNGKVLVNPKTFNGVVGGPTGKLSSVIEKDGITMVELITNGNSQQTPSVYGLTTHTTTDTKGDPTILTRREMKENTTVSNPNTTVTPQKTDVNAKGQEVKVEAKSGADTKAGLTKIDTGTLATTPNDLELLIIGMVL